MKIKVQIYEQQMNKWEWSYGNRYGGAVCDEYFDSRRQAQASARGFFRQINPGIEIEFEVV